MILYSKDSIISALKYMKTQDRFAHSFLLTGDKGVGKKTTALYIAKSLLCENPSEDGVPCGSCRQCRRIDNNTHPDVIIPERVGKKQIYNKETVRNICYEAFIMPNDCEAKVYILPDCENIEVNTQNLMLKLIEEPPEFCYFIFTAGDRSVFLPTILSRVIAFSLSECSPDEAISAITSLSKYSDVEIQLAVSHYHGNIGLLLSYLEKGEAFEDVNFCKSIVDALVSGNEYELNKAFFSIGENRERLKNILSLLDKIVRDALVLRLDVGNANAKIMSCYKNGAEALSRKISFQKAEVIHSSLHDVIAKLNSNANTQIAVASLCGVLI